MSLPRLPGIKIHRGTALAAIPLAAVALCGLSVPNGHPRLVEVGNTQCTHCHQDLFDNRANLHPAVENCTTCHDVRISESGTEITLANQNPMLCLGCHEHLRSAAEAQMEFAHAPVMDSCTICHEPHASAFPTLLASPVNDLCGRCHDPSDIAGTHKNQITETTNCLRCHPPHGSTNQHMLSGSQLHPPFADGDCNACHRAPFSGRVRLRARGERMCTACHRYITEPVETGGSQHEALFAQRPYAGCISCHDPHMSSRPFLLVKEKPQLCWTCHESVVKAAMDETGHQAAADNCTSCHAPHRSERVRLLIAPLPGLCLSCHDPKKEGLAKAHLGADMGSLQCMSCHTPHGSGNPKLLARGVHAPMLDRCEICHQGSVEDLVEKGESDLCFFCHDDIGEIARNATVPHEALRLQSCTACHNPHASAEDGLIRAPGAGACVGCHEEQVATESEFAHGVIALIGCRACHEPHGGINPKLLRYTGNELCLGCHDAQNMPIQKNADTILLLDRFKVPAEAVRSLATLRLSADGQRDHPVTGHRVLGVPTEEELKSKDSTFKGELTCLTCHDPHKSAAPQMLVGDARSPMDSCAPCHPQ